MRTLRRTRRPLPLAAARSPTQRPRCTAPPAPPSRPPPSAPSETATPSRCPPWPPRRSCSPLDRFAGAGNRRGNGRLIAGVGGHNVKREAGRRAMKAIRVHRDGEQDALVLEEAPTPHPGPGEVLVRVQATGVTPTELGWWTTRQTRAGIRRSLPIPGHDLAGIVADVGPEVRDVAVGTPVFALTDFTRDGAGAEYAI